MNIFKKQYQLRTFSKQKTVRGYAVKASSEDRTVSLNVQPVVSTELKSLPEGDRVTKGIKSYGDFPVQTADVEKGIQADRLFYAGEWYECISSSYFEHTPLSHWKSIYTLVSEVDTTDGSPEDEEESE